MKTNNTKKVTLFDNYNGYSYEEIKQYLINLHIENNKDNMTWINYQPTDEDIYEYTDFSQDMDWQDLESELKNYLTNHTLIVSSDSDWINGTILDSIEDLCELVCDCDYIEMYDEDGILHLNYAKHNSGFAYTELKLLTNKGKEYLERHNKEDLSKQEIKTLLSKTYSKKPNYAHTEYGCK